MGNILFFAGTGIAILSGVGLLAELLFFRTRQRRLNEELEQDYGPDAQR